MPPVSSDAAPAAPRDGQPGDRLRDDSSPWDRWGPGLIGAFTIALVIATWSLWRGGTDYPLIPWLGGMRHVPLIVDRAFSVGLLVVSLCLTLSPLRSPKTGDGGPRSRLLEAALVTWLGLGILDQHRLQPWAWLFWLETLALWGLPAGAARLQWTRAVVISLYVWSAVSKLDASFLTGRGPWLLTGLFQGLGLSTALISPARLARLAILLPVGELLVASCLAFRPTRVLGRRLAIGMHAALLIALGPWGHDHHLGVLLWNLYFLCQTVLLFRDAPPDPSVSGETSADPRSVPGRRVGLATRGLLAAAIAAPALASLGLYDHWPAWEVYSDRPEIVRVWVSESALAALPRQIRRSPPLPLSDLCEIQLDDWSFVERHCPIYPQARYRLALVRTLVERGLIREAFRVTIETSPNRWTGRRTTIELGNLPALVRACDEFCVNTRPRVP